jgi:hypothetical protein
MSEKLSISPAERHAALSNPERKALPTAEQAEPLRRGEQDPLKKLRKARHEVSQATKQNEQSPVAERLQAAEKASQPAQSNYINRELKAITLRRELQHIRRKLPVPQRTLSKLIHQPAVRAVSEGAGKTVTRPSGLLGGGVTAFVGTSIYLYIANHRGFDYNYGVFIALFVAGFVLGLCLELAVYYTRLYRRRN